MKLILSSLALGAAATPSAMNLMGDPETPAPTAPVAVVAPVEPVAPLATLLPVAPVESVASLGSVAPVAAAAPVATSLPARAPRPTVPVRLATLPQDDDLAKTAKELEQEIARLRERLGEMKRVVGEAKRGEITRELRGRIVAPRATGIRAAAEEAREQAGRARVQAEEARARVEELRSQGLTNAHSRLIRAERALQEELEAAHVAQTRSFKEEIAKARALAEEARARTEEHHLHFEGSSLPRPLLLRSTTTSTTQSSDAPHAIHGTEGSTINIHVEDGDVIIHAGGATVNTTSGKASAPKSKDKKNKGKDKKKSKSKKKNGQKDDDAFGIWISDDEHGGNTFRWSSDDGDGAEGFTWVAGDDEDGAHIFQGMSGGDHVVFGSDGEAGLFFAGGDDDEDVRIFELPGGGEAKVMVRNIFGGDVSEECDVDELLAEAGEWIGDHEGNIVFMDALNGAQFGLDGDTFEFDMDVDVDLDEGDFAQVFKGLESLEGLKGEDILKGLHGVTGKASINGKQFVFPGGNTNIDIETLLEGQGFDAILKGADIEEDSSQAIIDALKSAGGGERTFTFPGGSGTVRVETSGNGDVNIEEVIKSLGGASQGYFTIGGDDEVDVQVLLESVKGKDGEAPRIQVRELRGKTLKIDTKPNGKAPVLLEKKGEADGVLKALEALGYAGDSNQVVSGRIKPVPAVDAELVDMVRQIRTEVQAMRAELAELREAVTAAPAKREGRPLRSTRR